MEAPINTLYVACIEGTKSYVPASTEKLAGFNFLIKSCEYFDPEDMSSLFQFIPGDRVSSKLEAQGNYLDKQARMVLVADRIIDSLAPNRKSYMLKFLLADQEGALTERQQREYKAEIEQLKEELSLNSGKYYHPALLRWYEQSK